MINGKLSKSYLRPAAVVLVSSTLTTSMPTPATAFVDPFTVMAVASLAATALSLGAKGNRVPLEIAQANLEATISLHKRMDNVEKSLGVIMLSLATLPHEIREIVKRELEDHRADNAIGSIEGIQQRMRVLAKTGEPIEKDHLIEGHMVDLIKERNVLLKMPSDLVVASLVKIYLGEANVLRAMGKSVDLAVANSVYGPRFAAAQDETREGSLAWMRKELLDEQTKAEKKLAGDLNMGSDRLREGNFPWLKHTEVRTRVEKREIMVKQFDPEVGRFVTVPSSRSISIDFDDHSTVRTRTVSLKPVDPRFGTKIAIVTLESPIVTPGGLPDAEKHRSDAEYNAKASAAQDQLQAEIDRFNERAEKIDYLSNILALVSVLRSEIEVPGSIKVSDLVVPMPPDDLAQLTARRKKIAENLIAETSASRAEAWEGIKESEQKIGDAVKAAEKERWRGETIMFLQVVAASSQLVQALKAEAATSDLRDAGAAADEVLAAVGSNKKVQRPQIKPDSPVASATPSVPRANADSQSAPENASNRPQDPARMSGRDRYIRLAQIKEQIRVASEKPDQTDGISPRTRLSLEAISILDAMTPSAADRFASIYNKRPTEILLKAGWDVAKAGDWKKGRKEVLVEALRPWVLNDGTFDSVSSKWLASERAFYNYYLFRDLDPRLNGYDVRKWAEQSWQEYQLCKDGCWKAVPKL